MPFKKSNPKGRQILKDLDSGSTENLHEFYQYLRTDEQLFQEAWPSLLKLLRKTNPPARKSNVQVPPLIVHILTSIWAGLSALKTSKVITSLLPAIVDAFPYFIPWLELAIFHAAEGNVVPRNKFPPESELMPSDLFFSITAVMLGISNAEQNLESKDSKGRKAAQPDQMTKLVEVPNYVYYSARLWFLNVHMMTRSTAEFLPPLPFVHDLFCPMFIEPIEEEVSPTALIPSEDIPRVLAQVQNADLLCLRAISLATDKHDYSLAAAFKSLIAMRILVQQGLEYNEEWKQRLAIAVLSKAFYWITKFAQVPARGADMGIVFRAIGECSSLLVFLLDNPSHWRLALSKRLFTGIERAAYMVFGPEYRKASPPALALDPFIYLLQQFQRTLLMESVTKHIPVMVWRRMKDVGLLDPKARGEERSPAVMAFWEVLETFGRAVDTSYVIYKEYSKAERKLCGNAECPTGPAPKKTFKVCDRCCVVYYCSRECQKRDWWKRHKRTCVATGDGGPAFSERDIDFMQYQKEIRSNEKTMEKLFGSDWEGRRQLY